MNRAAFVAVLVFWLPASAQEAADLAPEQVLNAIAIFGSDPLSERGMGMASVIVSFADASKDVEVSIDPGLHGWLVKEPRVKYNEPLLAAFIAGNVRSQLETGIARDDTYSGLLFLFRIYNKLKRGDKNFSIPIIEEQLKAHREGVLHEYIAKHRTAKNEREDVPQP